VNESLKNYEARKATSATATARRTTKEMQAKSKSWDASYRGFLKSFEVAAESLMKYECRGRV
jgi:hypothetical protein